MVKRELKEYIDLFSDDTEVSVIIADIKTRKRYPITGHHGITDLDGPTFLLEIGKPEPLDEMVNNTIPGQIGLEDFPEVLP